MEDVVPASAVAGRRLTRLGVAAGCIFVLGGGLFALGAVLAQSGTTSLTTVNVTYLVGGFFFSLGGYVTIVLADGDRARRSAVVLFAGTLSFAVSLVAAFAAGLTPRQSNGWVWLPDIVGCICFLVSGHLALLDVGHGRLRVRPGLLGWWVAAVNQLGSILFFLAGLAAFTRPATDQAVNTGLVNWGTFAGAICFAVAGVIQVLDSSFPTRTVGLTTP